MKGGVDLPDKGYIQVHAYTGNAQIPLQNVSVAITDTGGSAIALRLTNRSGMLDTPVPIEVPSLSAGQTPDTGIIPFSVVNLYARLENFEQIEIENLQIFPNTITDQNLELIPLSEFPDQWTKTEIFNTPPQNL
jgi:hypothetical protein